MTKLSMPTEALAQTKNTMNKSLNTWIYNLRLNSNRINHSNSLKRITTTLGNRTYTDILLCGTGESLETIQPQSPTTLIICSQSAASTLYAKDIEPQIILIIDSSSTTEQQIIDCGWHAAKAIVVTHPAISKHTTCIPYLQKLYFKLYNQNPETGSYETEYNHFLDTMFPELETFMTQAGSVASIMLQLVKAMRNLKILNPIIKTKTIGLDFGFKTKLKSNLFKFNYETETFQEDPTPKFTWNEIKVDSIIKVDGPNPIPLTNKQQLVYAYNFLTVRHLIESQGSNLNLESHKDSLVWPYILIEDSRLSLENFCNDFKQWLF